MGKGFCWLDSCVTTSKTLGGSSSHGYGWFGLVSTIKGHYGMAQASNSAPGTDVTNQQGVLGFMISWFLFFLGFMALGCGVLDEGLQGLSGFAVLGFGFGVRVLGYHVSPKKFQQKSRG